LRPGQETSTRQTCSTFVDASPVLQVQPASVLLDCTPNHDFLLRRLEFSTDEDRSALISADGGKEKLIRQPFFTNPITLVVTADDVANRNSLWAPERPNGEPDEDKPIIWPGGMDHPSELRPR
jgi:hypothetical protein